MNERIRELALQTGYKNTRWNTTEEFEEFLDEFAELIVQECLDVLFLRQNPKHYMPDPKNLNIYNQGWIDGRDSGIIDIKKHFGVEK